MLWMRLAALWGCTRREAQERCDADEFTDWMAFDNLQPFGDYAQDIRDAMLMTIIANQSTRRGRRFKVSDFRLGIDPKPLPDRETLRQRVKAAFSAMAANGGKPIRVRRD